MLLSYRVFTIIMIFMLEIQRVQVNVLVYRSILRKLKSYESNCIVSYRIISSENPDGFSKSDTAALASAASEIKLFPYIIIRSSVLYSI